jgi:hypothetical protein
VSGADGPASEPLVLVLYPTREEYLAKSGRDLGGLESVLSWTAGHYDLSANVSRIFLPEEERGEERLLGVYAHELTHHWLAARSAFGAPRSGLDAPGYWIVEGIATWAEELVLDPARSTWTAVNPRAPSWTRWRTSTRALPPVAFLALSYEGYRARDPPTTAPARRQLGMHASRSPMQLFYAQGGPRSAPIPRRGPATVPCSCKRSAHRGSRSISRAPLARGAGERVTAFARAEVQL